jgi:hypothetical protein
MSNRTSGILQLRLIAAVPRALHAQRPVLRIGAGMLAAGVALALNAPASAAVFPAEFDLSDLLVAQGGDGSAGFVLNGIAENDWAGASVSAAGDINDDGIDDLIVGALFAEPNGVFIAGESYVVFGRAGGFQAEVELASLLSINGGDGSAGFVLQGIDAEDISGETVSAGGDLNGDGIDDLVVSAPGASPIVNEEGETYVVFGRNTEQSGNFPAELPLSSLLPGNGGDGSVGFVIIGIHKGDAYAGLPLSAAGDVNGDGIDDLIIGAGKADAGRRPDAGQSYVLFGRDAAHAGSFPALVELATLLPERGGDGSTGFVIRGIDVADWAGFSVSGAGDVNGDGIHDLIIGARHADPGGRESAGESYVVLGRDTAHAGNFPAILALRSLLPPNGNGSAGVVLAGTDAYDVSGYSVGAAGDVNGDGIDDLIIGAFAANPNGRADAGQSYVLFGRDNRAVWRVSTHLSAGESSVRRRQQRLCAHGHPRA